jgi:hypothetical protein
MVSLAEIMIAVPAELTVILVAVGAVLSTRIVPKTAEDRLLNESAA